MFSIQLDNTSVQPLYEQIYHYFCEEIKNGSLVCQTKLPSTRSLAAQLSVSRTTVEMAYAQLLSEGYIESYPKSGYYVSETVQLANISVKTSLSEPVSSANIRQYQYDFSPFAVDMEHFPYHTWRQLSKKCLQEESNLFSLGDNRGDHRFRSAIASYLHQSRNVNCTPEQIVVGAGVDYLLQLLVRILGTDTIFALENPAYMRAYHVLSGLGCTTIPVPVDKSGMCTEILHGSAAQIAYVTPSHQYPLGIVMPVKRRMELLNWSYEKEERYILEDDHDSEFRYKGKPIPSLQGMDSNEKVIYIGTFSRAIAPAIRVSYMVLPPQLMKRYVQTCYYYSSTVSRIDQAILSEFMEQGYFERHLNRMRKIYKSKHDTLLHTLKDANIPVSFSGEYAGMHLVVSFHTHETEQEIIQKAASLGIKLYGLSEHYIQTPEHTIPSFLFGYANLTEEDIKKGLHLLFHTYKSEMPPIITD